jgi:hypothetical protein
MFPGATAQSPAQFVTQSLAGSFSWGTQPGTATIVYIAPTANWVVATGALLTMTIGAHFFAGVCISDVENQGSAEGLIRTLQFKDLREFLQWDYTYCAFNKPDVILVNGRRIKRYKHVYPADFNTLTWTYTNSPLEAWEIINAILGYKAFGLLGGVVGGTVGSPWAWDLTGLGLFPEGVFNFPIYDYDCLNGKRLDAVMSDFSERSGCVMGLASSPELPYVLTFTRKGYGVTIDFPENSDNRRSGFALSGHPTNVRILGDRNLYQVMGVPMQADWASGWEQFLVFEQFADDIYHRATNPLTAATYDQTPNDPEGYIGRQLATAAALSMTVQQYVDLRNATSQDGAQFVDGRKFAARFRMDMPAALYISTLLWRAFRPADSFTFYNAVLANNSVPNGGGAPLGLGLQVPLPSLDIADKLLCKVFQNDPTSGLMNFDVTTPSDGNGFAIAKGYMVGADLFKSISSSQFSLNFFKNASAVWQHVPFQIDDSGEEVRFIIFDEPVILSENLIVAVNGYNVINAQATLSVPPVNATLTFEAERFSYIQGTYPDVSKDSVENVGGLNLEAVVSSDGYTEVPYADGTSAFTKASVIATNLLLRQYIYSEGGLRLIYDPRTAINSFGTPLSSLTDRVQIETSPKGGTFEVVDLTNERTRDTFEPERELDRKTQSNSLFPGQAELRIQAEYARKLASAFRQLPGIRKALSDLIAGQLGNDQPLTLTWLVPVLNATLPVGTVLRRAQTMPGTPNTNTVPVPPALVQAAHNIFMGVTVRDAENGAKPFRVQSTGRALALVQGPVNNGDPVGLSDGSTSNNCLVKNGTTPVGIVRQDIAGSAVTLVEVDLGVGGAGTPAVTVQKFYYVSSDKDFITAQMVSGDVRTNTKIAKPPALRGSIASKTIDAGSGPVTWLYKYQTFQNSWDSRAAQVEGQGLQYYQRISPPWLASPNENNLGSIIIADLIGGSTGIPGVGWQARADGRAWANKKDQSTP